MFLTCPKCFYLDRVKGLNYPDGPSWALNNTTDLLLKKEFDTYREEQKPHPLFKEHGLEYLVPYQHVEMDDWRDPLRPYNERKTLGGLVAQFEDTNIILTGGVDDIWQDTRDGRLAIVEYKAQANRRPLNAESYLGPYRESYRIQIDFYVYLFQELGFDISESAYFLVCNANQDAEGFFAQMGFSESLIPYRWNTDWIPAKLSEMVALLNQEHVPDSHPSCNNCEYARQRAVFE